MSRPFPIQILSFALPLLLLLSSCSNGSKEGTAEKEKKETSSSSLREKEDPDPKEKETKKRKEEKEEAKPSNEGEPPEQNSRKTRPTTRSMAPASRSGTSSSPRPKPGTERFRERFDQSPELHKISSQGDTIVRCEKGTELHFPPEPFMTMEGEALTEGKVRIRVKEYYGNAEILLAGLETKSGERPLGTGGMVHIEAESDGKECRLKEGKAMKIGFPRKEGQEDMKLFAGEREADGGMDWKLEAEKDLNRTYSEDELDEEASFPGGAESKAGYIREKTSYPATAQAQGREGIVRIGAEIAKDGSLEEMVLLDSVAPSLNRSAFETVRNMPSWIPAKKDGQRARSRTTIEVRFSLGEGFEEEEKPEPMSPKELEKKMENGGKITDASQEAVSDYLFQSSKMRGWHNCDRFLEELRFKEYTVELEETRDADVRIFFPEGNSFLNAKGEGTRYRFEQVPRNEEIRVIAIKDAEGGYGLAIESTNSRKEDPELNFEKVGMEDLKAAMEELNGI